MTHLDRPRRILYSALTLSAFVGGAWAQSVVVRNAGSGEVHSAISQEVQIELRQSSNERNQAAITGKRIQLIVEARVDTKDWQARLTNTDIDAREQAFDELVARARQDTSLSLALQSWSQDPAVPELAWCARMALRELHAKRSRPMAIAWVPRRGPDEGSLTEAQFGSSTAQSLESGAAPVPEQLRNLDPGGVLPLADRRMLSLSAPRVFGMPVPPGSQHIEFQPEGVTLVVKQLDQGQVRVRKYADSSLESLLKAHPELRGMIPALASINTRQQSMTLLRQGNHMQGAAGQWMRAGVESPGSTFQIVRGGAPRGAEANANDQPSRLILGVKVTALSLSEAEGRLLGPGVGLVIERREPGSIAEALDLRRGDILVELFGQQLCSAEEISRLLQENQGSAVTVKFVDRDGIERERTYQPAAPTKR